MMTVFQAFSQFERDLIVQRTKEGLNSARARGRQGGRPKVNERELKKAINLYKSEQYSVSEIVEMIGISRAVYQIKGDKYNYLPDGTYQCKVHYLPVTKIIESLSLLLNSSIIIRTNLYS